MTHMYQFIEKGKMASDDVETTKNGHIVINYLIIDGAL